MAKTTVYVDHLRGVPLFESLSKKELQRVAQAGTQISEPAGTVLMEEGRRGRSALVVLEGKVTVSRNGRKVADVGAGSALGELSLLDDQPRSASAVCSTDCMLLEIPGGQFRAMLDEVPSIRVKLLATLAARVR